MRPIATLAAALAATSVALSPLALPGASGPVGFDDLRYSPALHRVLVPGGRTGRVYLVDPATRAVQAIAGFSASGAAGTAHGESTTSADSGQGLVFASDRSQRAVLVVDPSAGRIVARTRLRAAPDYVRWVGPRREVWVTEPRGEVIETFRLGDAPPALAATGEIAVADGPESLEIDAGRRRAYTNTWHGQTLAIDLDTRAVVARWENGCRRSRGLALDERRGLVFVGCDEGSVAVLGARGGRVIGRAPTGPGVDVIAYAPGLSHLYAPGGEAAGLTVVGVAEGGAPMVLGQIATARDAHCVTADGAGGVYVCDPGMGRLLTFRDPFPASR